jgi:hypothetical protein
LEPNSLGESCSSDFVKLKHQVIVNNCKRNASSSV